MFDVVTNEALKSTQCAPYSEIQSSATGINKTSIQIYAKREEFQISEGPNTIVLSLLRLLSHQFFLNLLVFSFMIKTEAKSLSMFSVDTEWILWLEIMF